MFKNRLLAFWLASAVTALVTHSQAGAAQPAPFQFDKSATQLTTIPTTAGDTLRKIAGDRSDLFFDGEYQSRSLPFFALPDEASTAAKLVLTLQTAISVAPEDSQMKIAINGTPLGITGLVAGDPRRIELAVPAGLIHPGYNAVAIETSQRHRVDCSINATYELWTKIDPDKSGFIYSGVAKPSLSLVDLLPLAGAKDGRTPIRVVIPAGADMTAYDRAMRAVEALTIFGNFNHPAVEFASTPGTGLGIDLFVGTKAELTPLLGDNNKILASGEHAIVDADNSSAERKRLIITGMDSVDVDQRVKEFATFALNDHPVGTREGLTALTNLRGRTLMPGDKVSLKDLGYSGRPFSGRFEVSRLNFAMPSDFYPGDYSSINFHLSARYIGGLAPDAVLVVKANDKEVANIQLSSTREGEIRDQRLPIPFSVLRPGQNTLSVEARVPSRLDAACDNVDNASSSVRIAISENSYLDVPDYARIGRYPDIAGLTSGLTPKLSGTPDPLTYIFVPGYDRQALNAAATFLAKMAFSSGKVKPVEFTSTLPDLDTSNVIAFGAYDTLPSELTSRLKLDFVNIRAAQEPKQSPFEVASLDGVALPVETTDDTQKPKQSPSSLAKLSSIADDFVANPAELSGRAIDGVKSKTLSEMRKLNLKYLSSLLDPGRNETYSPLSTAALVVAQSGSDNGGVWTVVAARSADMLQARTDVLTDYNVWNKLNGAIQSFGDTGEILDQKSSSSEHLFQTEPLTFANARLVAAGWLANNAEIYIGALLATAILLGIGTFMVLITGRRNHG
jgi:hypothetical protein